MLLVLFLIPMYGSASALHLERLSAISAGDDASVALAITDTRHALTLATLESLDTLGDWEPTPARRSYGYSAGPTWLRADLNDAGNLGLLIISNPWLEDLELWFLDENGLIAHFQTGSRRDFSARALPMRDYVFPVPAHAERVFIRAGGNSPHYVPVQRFQADEFLRWQARQNLGYGLYFGIILIMLLYNLGLYVGFRDRAYLLYAAYAGTVCISMAVVNGFAQHYLWPGLGGVDRSVSYVLVALGIGLSYWFAAVFLRVPGNLPRTHVVFTSLALVMLAAAIWGVFSPAAWIGRLNASMLLVLTSGLLVLGLARWYQGYRLAAVYVFAHGWMVLGTLSFTAMLLGLLPDIWLTRHGIIWGSITELSLLAFALSQRIHEERRSRLAEQARASELENRVSLLQRETDIARAHQEELQALHHSQKLRTIGEMTRGFAHEFNNLLAGILGFTELSQEHARERKDDRLLSYLTEIERGSVRGSVLVRQLLTFSRGSRAEPVPLNLAQCVQESAELLRATLPATVNIQTQVTDTPTLVEADPGQLQQAIINIGLNAAEAMDNRGDIRISAEVAQVNRNCASCLSRFRGTYLVISIGDSGRGIQTAPEELFTPFYTTKPVGDGAGLGLSVVHGIVHQYNGHIGVDSNPDQGTTVHLYLPLPNVTLHR